VPRLPDTCVENGAGLASTGEFPGRDLGRGGANGGAQPDDSGTLDPELDEVASGWPGLGAADRERVRAVIRSNGQ
jgi:hypothetical protein